jgi:hypothetical protein
MGASSACDGVQCQIARAASMFDTGDEFAVMKRRAAVITFNQNKARKS